MTTAIGSTISAITGALGSQSRAPGPGSPRRVDTSTQAIAVSRDLKIAKVAKENAEAERLMDLLTDPQVMGLLTVFAGLFLAQQIPWSQDEERNGAIRGIASSSAVLMGLSRAGVGDLTTLAVAVAAGLASLEQGGSSEWPLTWEIAGWPVASAFGPIPMLKKLAQTVT